MENHKFRRTHDKASLRHVTQDLSSTRHIADHIIPNRALHRAIIVKLVTHFDNFIIQLINKDRLLYIDDGER